MYVTNNFTVVLIGQITIIVTTLNVQNPTFFPASMLLYNNLYVVALYALIYFPGEHYATIDVMYYTII